MSTVSECIKPRYEKERKYGVIASINIIQGGIGIEREKVIPWGLLYTILLLMLAGVYFISGLFTFPDVNMFNYGDKLEYILRYLSR